MTVDNVYIFVADALRDDHLPDSVREVGEYVPTIATGTNSPEGFASIVSGLYPNQHQAHAFTHRLNPAFNYLNAADTHDTRFFQIYETELAEVLGMEQETENPVDDLAEPFAVMERDMTTHAPFGHPSYENVDIGPQEYFGDKNVDWERIRTDYREASERVGNRFLQRLDELEAAGKLENTLVIFTADHGELLGEYSEMSHGEPLVPELARVPTVVRNPDPDAPDPVPDVMSLVDILPTITDVLDECPPWTTPGRSIYDADQRPYRVCERKSKPHTLNEFSFQNFYNYSVRSVWGADGGHAFKETSFPGLCVHAFRQTPLFNPLRGRDAIRAFEALYHHLRPTRTFGTPGFTTAEAKEYLREMDDFSVQLSRTTEEISEGAREELEHLGYL
ncbi:MAG: sulfatase-like hydrolase/transferase [Haloplanus sp.]